MEARINQLEKKVEELSKTVELLRARLDAVSSAPESLEAGEPARLPDALNAIDPGAARSAVPLIGRSLLVIAGAFVFRLITERELVTRPVGVALGLSFAALWVFLSWRDAGKGKRLSAAFHAGAGALVGFALLLETGSREVHVAAPLIALGLAVFTLLLLATAWRHRLPEVAWLAQLGCLAAGGGLLRSAQPLPFFVVLLALGVSSVVFADFRQWPLLRWPVALFLDLAALRLVFSLSARSEAEQGGQLGPIVLVTQAVIGLYVLWLLLSTWVRHHPVRAFEVVQTALVLTVGLLTITRVQGAAGAWGLLVAAGALATAFWVSSLEGRAFDGWFYGVLSLALTLASGPLLLSGAALGLFWAAVGLALAVVGRARLTSLMWGGAALLLWAAAWAGGTLEVVISGLVRAPTGPWAAPTPVSALLVAFALAGWVLLTGRVKRPLPGVAVALVGLVALGSLALCAHGARMLFGDATSLIILLRTLLLCGLAVALAASRRFGAPIELSWAAWGLVVLSGLKVLAQDLPHGNAGTLVIAFLALGLALIAVPRLLKPMTPPAHPKAVTKKA